MHSMSSHTKRKAFSVSSTKVPQAIRKMSTTKLLECNSNRNIFSFSNPNVLTTRFSLSTITSFVPHYSTWSTALVPGTAIRNLKKLFLAPFPTETAPKDTNKRSFLIICDTHVFFVCLQMHFIKPLSNFCVDLVYILLSHV